METFCQKLPKIELHAHLNGSLSKSTLKQLGCSEESIKNYQETLTDIKQVFNQFQVAHNATNTLENLNLATKCVIEDFAKDNVIYLELRTTPRSEKDLSERDYIETVVEAIRNYESSKIIVKLILSLDRRRSWKEQLDTLDNIIDLKQKYPDLIKGVDLSGDPGKGEFFKKLFEKARDNGLKTAIHCGEIKNDNEVMDILDFKPDRIGHGTCLHPDYGGSEEIWQKYQHLKIPIECCLTSNVVCLTSKSYEEHHVKELLKNSLPFSLATDDKGVFNTTLSKEFTVLGQTFSLSKNDLWNISRNSIDYSFADEEEKGFIRFALEQWKIRNIENYPNF
ncbi:hypothetical protein ABEB36_002286 [Hypothenemus hampei]|uniref:Adenosine deaminase domain-containing protein n=1 Tax=Hypothenemus hampei TaxID=57062 RepID=A0ABD1F5U4_HYPHA